MKAERRRFIRAPGMGKVKLHWRTPEGFTYQEVAACLDISRTGAKLELRSAIPQGTMLQLESRDLHIAGVAYVRHCKPRGMKFTVGVEFLGGMEWSRPVAR
ncbi:MAG: PilZ domain-containing protein [Candidatus Solibacter usitatus]|nr:PilZ domain-containing protein [Candidatus Solibacter usitatus]